MIEPTDLLETRIGQTVRRIFEAVEAERSDVAFVFDFPREHRGTGTIWVFPPIGSQDLPPAQQPDAVAHHVSRDLVHRLVVRIWGTDAVDAEDLLHAFEAALSTADADDDDTGGGYLRAAVGVTSIGAWQGGVGAAGVAIPLELAIRVPVYDADLRRARRPLTAPLSLAVERRDGSTEPA